MKSIFFLLILFFSVSITEEPAGWTFVEIYMLTRGLNEEASIRYKMEAVGTVWEKINNEYIIVNTLNTAYYPPSGNTQNTLNNALYPDILGFNFINSGSDAGMDSFGYGLYKIEVVGGSAWFTIDYSDSRYNTYQNSPGHDQDIWVKYDASSNTFSYRNTGPNLENIDNETWTSISNGANLSIWSIKNQSSYGSPNVDAFQPTTPETLQISNYYGHPKLIWTPSEPVTGAKYKIYRNNDLVYTTNIGETEWIDEYVVIGGGANAPFIYKVQGLSGDGTKTSSGCSNEVTVHGIRYDKQQQQTTTSGQPQWTSAISDIYPNPFNPETMIRFTIGEEQNVNIMVFDAAGKEVKILLEAVKPKGEYEIRFNASHLSSGVYYCRMTLGKHTETKKIVLQK